MSTGCILLLLIIGMVLYGVMCAKGQYDKREEQLLLEKEWEDYKEKNNIQSQ